MPYEIVKTKSLKATASLATSQFCFVTLDANGQIVLPSAGAYCEGVLQDKPGAGDPGAVCYPGDITRVVVGTGGVTAGADVATDASGHAVAVTSGAYILGQALETQATSGNIATILYQPKGSHS